MRMISRLSTLLLLALALSACAPSYHGAKQIGSAEPATWVYVDTDDDASVSGIYRCDERNGRPVCQRAKMKR